MNKQNLIGALAAPLLMWALAVPSYADSTAAATTTTTTCKDGSMSATSGRGACSGHGGVQKGATMTLPAASTTQSTAAQVPVPAAPTATAAGEAAPTACKDGSTSASSGRGACSGHGGVQKAAKMTSEATTGVPASAAPAAKSTVATASASASAGDTDATGATAKCKDGTYSKAAHRTGACSKHGGVDTWMAATK